MHSRLRYSLFAFLASALFHASLWGLFTTYKTDKKTKPTEKIAMQVTMFKQVVVPKPVVRTEPATIPPLFEPIKKRVTSTPKPVSKKKPKAKAKQKKIKPKKTLKKKPKKVVKQKTVQKRPLPKLVREVAPSASPQRSNPLPANKPRITTSEPRANVKSTPVTRTTKQQVPQPAYNPQLEKQYQRSVQLKIEQQKSYPHRAKRKNKQGIVKVGFTIKKNGAVSNLRIVQSSGISSLDKATLKAVKKVGRFPVFPVGMNKQSLRYIIPIAYRLN